MVVAQNVEQPFFNHTVDGLIPAVLQVIAVSAKETFHPLPGEYFAEFWCDMV